MNAVLALGPGRRIATLLRHAMQHVPAIVSGVLALCVGADSLSRYLALRAAAMPASAKAVRVAQMTPKPVLLQGILTAHLFGIDEHGVESTPTAASGLSAHLTGTIAIDGVPDHGFAMFEGADHLQHLLGVGSSVEAGRVLVAVYADHVELDHEGVREAVVLPRHQKIAPRRMVALARNDPETNEQRVEQSAGAHSRFLRPIDGDSHGLFKGVEIAEAAEGLESLGIHTGDTVVSINGVRVSSPDALTELNSGGTVALGLQNENGYHVVHVNSTLLQ